VPAAERAGRDRLQAARLQGEPEVHRLDGVAQRTRARQVGHVPAGQQVEGPAVVEPERLDPVRGLMPLHHRRGAGQLIDGDLPGEVPGVQEHRPVLQQAQVLPGDHGLGPGHGNHHVRGAQGLLAARDGEAVQARFQPRHRVDLDHRDRRARVPEIGRHALPACPVPEDRDLAAVGHPVGDAQV